MGEYSLYNPSSDQNQDSLAHYGRLGMKWYQHIYGEYQGAAKYAEKGEKKLAGLKTKNAKLVSSIDTQVAKNDKLQGKHALKAAKYRAAQKDEKSIKEDVLAAKFGAKSANLKNTKQKALNKEAKLSEKVDRVKDTVKKLEEKAKAAEEAKNPLKDVDVTQHDKELTARINKDYYSPDTDAWSDPPKDEINKAADLGLKALIKQGMADKEDVGDPGMRDWFLYEDQTIGMPTVAHLINKGNSAKDVKEFIRKVNDAHDNTDDDNKRHAIYEKYFDLLWGDDLESFADDCEKVKRRESVKHDTIGSSKTYAGLNEYSLYNPDSELAHHGILGMKWGVRRYQNPDGSLTALGRKRFARSRNNRFVNAFDTMAAKKIYQKKSSKISSEAKVLSKMSEKEARKANEFKDVDSEKASKHEHKANLYSLRSEAYKQASDILSQRVKDIDSGVLKAGEDFIVQVDKNWYGLFSTTEKRIVLNQKNEAKKSDPLYENVMETYEVRNKGKRLKPEHEQVTGIEKKLTDHRNSFLKNNPPESEAFKRHLENRLKEMTTNDSDGEEIRNSIREETSALAKSGRLSTSSTGFEMAYADYCRNDSAYKKLNKKLSKARDAYDTKANTLAAASYRKHGASAIDEWDPENVSQRAPKHAIDILAYLMKESCEGRR